ncbi:MAG TPA: hypothetical protein VHM30_10805 [Gemmatimonadaceae bacterium]|nr:hypothetical protein [Gemmatimonadaceae bacterium]
MSNSRRLLPCTLALATFALIAATGGSASGQGATVPSFRALSAGESFACGVTRDDRAYCWGANYLGQVGTPNTAATCGDHFIERGACSRVPVPVSGGIRFASVRAGKTHACGVDVEGAAWCWGEAGRGQLGSRGAADQCRLESEALEGLPPVPCSHVPLRVESDLHFVAVDAGDEMSCGLDDRGRAWCWGWRGGDSAPAPVPLDEPLVSLDVGGRRACALTSDGTARCWAWPEVLQNGAIDRVGERQWTAIAVAAAHTCATGADGTVYCFGNDADGALGRGPEDHRKYRDYPLAPVAGEARVHFIALATTRSCAVDAGDRLLCWGRLGSSVADDRCLDSNGLAGSNDCTSAPVRVAIRDRVRGVTLGEAHGCVILDSGRSGCWGSNAWGQLGDGTRLESASVSFLAANDRSSSPMVWAREHWPSRVALRNLVAALIVCLLVVAAFRWPRRGKAVPVAATRRRDVGGLISIGLVVAGWAIVVSAFLAPSQSSGGHDDVALGLAWLAILIVGGIASAVVAVGGGVAIATLRHDRTAPLARVGLMLSALTLGAVLLAWVFVIS